MRSSEAFVQNSWGAKLAPLKWISPRLAGSAESPSVESEPTRQMVDGKD